jgi:secreted trypsin-like serine protease
MIVTGRVTDARYRATRGEGYDGVVLVSVNGHYGTGSLLYNGRAILTAAHLFTPNINNSANIEFQTTTGTQILSSSSVTLNPNYDTVNDNNDLAIIWLNTSAPITANRYNIYHNTDELGQTMTMVGYGEMGTGNTGAIISNSSNSVRMTAQNQFDADAATLKSYLGTVMNWTPTAGTQLVADFDNSSSTNDALGRLINDSGTGLGLNEGLIAPGDSGGPAFINEQIAGVASYTTSLSISSIHPDIDNQNNSSFGEIAAWQRVSHYQQWIDQSIRSK